MYTKRCYRWRYYICSRLRRCSATTPYFRVDGGYGGICYFKSTLHADGVQAGFGTGNDMQIQHNGAAGFINNACGILNICSADDVLIDAESDINLDANGADIRFKDDGTIIGAFQNSSSNFVIKSGQDNKDIIFCGVDDSSDIAALTLDMSDAGSAIFNHNISLPSAGEIDFDSGDVKFVHASNALTLQGATNGLKITGDGSNATALVESGAGEFK